MTGTVAPPRALEIEGWMTERELAFLYLTAGSVPKGARVVELGCWKGRSTVAICEGLAGRGARLWTIDTFEGGSASTGNPKEIHRELARNLSGYPFVTRIVADTISASAQFEDRTIDWIFIDADHSYQSVTADLAAWQPKMKPGGLVSGHDYGWISVALAVNRVFPKFCVSGTIWYTRERPRTRLFTRREVVLRKAASYARYRAGYHFREARR